MFLLVSVRHDGAHPDGHQHGVSMQISINLGKRFFEYLVYEIFLWPEIWRGSLSIERFWFLFWSILNGVILKTSNWNNLPISTRILFENDFTYFMDFRIDSLKMWMNPVHGFSFSCRNKITNNWGGCLCDNGMNFILE